MFTIDSKNIFTLTKGDSASFTVNVFTEDGTPYVLDAEDLIIFTVKKSKTSRVPLIQKVTTLALEGLIEIIPSDTKTLVPKSYFYDLQITLKDGTVNTMIRYTPFVVDWEITEEEIIVNE